MLRAQMASNLNEGPTSHWVVLCRDAGPSAKSSGPVKTMKNSACSIRDMLLRRSRGIKVMRASLRRLARLHCLALFHESLHPAENPFPAFSVTRGCLRVSLKADVTYLDYGPGANALRPPMLQPMDIARLQIPIHDRFQWMLPAGLPGVGQVPRRIDL